jgi:hypothetical protein
MWMGEQPQPPTTGIHFMHFVQIMHNKELKRQGFKLGPVE